MQGMHSVCKQMRVQRSSTASLVWFPKSLDTRPSKQQAYNFITLIMSEAALKPEKDYSETLDAQLPGIIETAKVTAAQPAACFDS